VLSHGDITSVILGAAIEVHRSLGPGLIESVYAECFCSEANERGLAVHREMMVPILYKGRELGPRLRVDLVVDDAVIVEMKSVESILPLHTAQLLTYLRLSRFRVGLLINWNVARLMDGVIRRVL
jgi:GxxExxY protein